MHMSSLLVVVKSHLFPQFVQEIGTSRGHWGDGEFAAVNCGWAETILGSYIRGAAAVKSIAMDGQSIGSKVAAAVTHISDSQ